MSEANKKKIVCFVIIQLVYDIKKTKQNIFVSTIKPNYLNSDPNENVLFCFLLSPKCVKLSCYDLRQSCKHFIIGSFDLWQSSGLHEKIIRNDVNPLNWNETESHA